MPEFDNEFDKEFAQEIIDKGLLVGLTFIDDSDKPIEKVQFYGKIIRVSEEDGIVLQRADTNQEYTLPPDLGSIHKADPGEYILHKTGEKIINPDYVTTWTIGSPVQDDMN